MLNSTLRERILDRFDGDPEYLVTVLGLTTEDLIDAFENKICEDEEFLDEMLGAEEDEDD